MSTGRQLNWWWEKAVKVCTSDSTAQLWSAPCAAHVLGEVLCVQCCSECMCEAANNALLEQCRCCCGTCACQRTCLCCLSAADLHNCHPFAWCQVLRTHCTGTLAPACRVLAVARVFADMRCLIALAHLTVASMLLLSGQCGVTVFKVFECFKLQCHRLALPVLASSCTLAIALGLVTCSM